MNEKLNTENGGGRRLLSIKQVADRLGVSSRTVWALRSAGRLRAVKLAPRVTRVEERDLDAFIDGAHAASA